MAENLEQVFGRAVHYYLSDNLDKAKKNCQKVLKKIPKHPDANSLLGSIYQKLGQHELALKHARIAVKTQPDYAQGWFNLGSLANQQNQYEEAKDAYLKCLELVPDQGEAWYGLANAYRDLGEREQAVEAYKKSIELKTDLSDAMENLAMVFLALKRRTEAIQYFEHAVAANPKSAEAYFGLGSLYNLLHRWDEALEYHTKALELRPEYYQVHLDMAKAMLSRNRYPAAKAAAEAALDIDQNLPAAHQLLAQALIGMGQTDNALHSAYKAIELNPNLHTSYTTLSKALARVDRYDEALEAIHKADELRPDAPENKASLGHVLQQLGKLTEAQTAFQEAIALRPDDPTTSHAYAALMRLAKYKEHNDITRQMIDLYDTGDLTPEQNMTLSFGLASLYERTGEYDRAFHHLAEANRIKREGYNYTTESTAKQFEGIKNTYANVIARQPQISASPADVKPIFILGMPRSGTTLTEQILASHPLVTGAGELEYFRTCISEVHRPQQAENTSQLPDTENDAPLSDDKIAGIGQCYLQKLQKVSLGNSIVTDKMPHNFMHLGLIKLAVPDAIIIHCKRKPLDNCLAIYKQNFEAMHLYAYDQHELGEYYRLYEDLMAFWHEQLPGQILDFQYEETVDDQEGQTRKLLEFCGLPWDDNCLQFHKTKRAVKTASVSQVRQPIYRDSLSLSERYGQHLNPLREALEMDIYPDSR